MSVDVEVKQLIEGISANFENMRKALEQRKSEIEVLGKEGQETKDTINKLLTTDGKLIEDFKEIAQLVKGNAYGDGTKKVKTFGQTFVESPQYKGMVDGNLNQSGKVSVDSFFGSKDITGNVADGMTPGYPQLRRIDTFTDPKQDLRIRDLLTVTPLTGATSVEYVKYTFTNNAAIIFNSSPSPTGRRENILKPVSDMDMTIANETAETIAHLVFASEQILRDIPQLRAIIDSELLYGLKFVEEDEILNGDGTAGHLTGLIAQAAAFSNAYDLAGTGEQALDRLRGAILQARMARYPVDGIVLNPLDLAKIETLKDGQFRYLVGDPGAAMNGMRVWGRRVVESESITAGHYLVGAFALGARLYDLQQANIQSTNSHNDFFQRNMVAIRAEERMLLVVPRPQAFVTGTLP